MFTIELKDDVVAAILTAIENGTEGDKAITTNGVAGVLGAELESLKAALAIMRESGLLDEYVVLRGKHGGFARKETAEAKREASAKVKDEKTEKSAKAIAERTAKALKSGALSKAQLQALIASVEAEEAAEAEAAVA